MPLQPGSTSSSAGLTEIDFLRQWTGLLSANEKLIVLRTLLLDLDAYHFQYIVAIVNAQAEKNAISLSDDIRKANSADTISRLNTDDSHIIDTLAKLNHYVPLLRSNSNCAAEYTSKMAACANYAKNCGWQQDLKEYFETCRDLLGLCMYHPAFEAQQSEKLEKLRQAITGIIQSASPGSLEGDKISSSESEVTQSTTTQPSSRGQSISRQTSRGHLNPRRPAPAKPDNKKINENQPSSESSELAVSASSSSTASASATTFNEQEFNRFKMWLKGLRLHKYETNLQSLSFDGIFDVTDEQLETLGVKAKGARNKLLKNLAELKTQMEQRNQEIEELDQKHLESQLESLQVILKRPSPLPTSPSRLTYAEKVFQILSRVTVDIAFKQPSKTHHSYQPPSNTQHLKLLRDVLNLGLDAPCLKPGHQKACQQWKASVENQLSAAKNQDRWSMPSDLPRSNESSPVHRRPRPQNRRKVLDRRSGPPVLNLSPRQQRPPPLHHSYSADHLEQSVYMRSPSSQYPDPMMRHQSQERSYWPQEPRSYSMYAAPSIPTEDALSYHRHSISGPSTDYYMSQQYSTTAGSSMNSINHSFESLSTEEQQQAMDSLALSVVSVAMNDNQESMS